MRRLLIFIGLLLSLTLNAQLNIGVVSAQKRVATEAASTLLDDLVSYWKLDESSGTINDEMNYADLTNSGAEYGTSGKVGTSMTFVAANSDGLTSAADPTSFRVQTFTIAGWVKPVDNDANRAMFGSSENGMELTVGADEKLILVASWTYDVAVSTGTVTTGAWNHIAVTYNDAGDYVFYINGSPSGSGNAHYTFTFLNETRVYIGRCNGGNYFNGDIDEVGFWDRVLTSDEITELYNAGSGNSYPF